MKKNADVVERNLQIVASIQQLFAETTGMVFLKGFEVDWIRDDRRLSNNEIFFSRSKKRKL